jgi:nicotinamidase-related amidase
LDLLLNANGIRTCLIAGADTEDGVQSTILSAVFHHYTPIIPEDCIGSLESHLHTQSLRVLRNSYDTTTSFELIQWLRARSPDHRVREHRASQDQELDALVAPAHSALIVVDVQNDFCSPQGDYDVRGVDIGASRAIIPVVDSLAEAAHHAGVMVVWLRASFLPDGLSDGAATRRFIGRHHDRPYCIVGTWGHGVADGLSPGPMDIVIDKFRADAFVGTPIHMFLNANCIRTVVLVGVVTQGCVDATARGAADHGYQVVCVEDGMAATTPELHAAGVAMMKHLFRVVRSDLLLQSWALRVVADRKR